MKCGGIINYLFKIGDKILTKSILAGILSIIALLVISNCGDNGINPTSNNEICPLNFNNYWKFDVYDFDTLGNIISQSTITYKIFDINGILLKSNVVNATTTTNLLTIDCSDLLKGVYTIQIICDKEKEDYMFVKTEY